MQQFKALFKKEIGGYFNSYFAYLVFGIYLFVSSGCAVYFGAYLAMHDTAVYALFYLQPAIAAVMIPALTMRAWSDEYKSGTAEFLFTQPLNNILPVLAKWAAAGLFVCVSTLFLLPFIIYTSFWLKLDWGGVFCSYAGLWLYIWLLCALGCFISSLSKYTVISYLLTVFVSALWLLISQTKLYEVYNNFLFAETGVFEFAYFLSFTIALIGLNVLVLNYRRSAQKNKNLRFWSFVILLITGVVLLNAAMFMIFSENKADFTQSRQYTLSDVSKKIVESIAKPITIDVYIAKDLKSKDAQYYYYYQQTKRFIEKYQKASSAMISVNVTEVEPFSEMEKSVLKNGLYYEENLKGTKDYFGAVIRDNEGQGVVIKQFIPQRQAYLESDIDKALLKLINKNVIKSIGIYFDPTQDLQKFNGFSLNLEEDYNVLSVSEDTYEISSNLDLLILVNPKTFAPSFLYAIDQYIANGGNVLIFFDLLTEGQSEETNMKSLQTVVFLDGFKILLDDEMTDEGVPADEYKIFGQNLKLRRAVSFTADEKEFTVKPVIVGKKGYVGAVVSGRYKSAFEYNPHKSKTILSKMMPHTIYSSETPTVAFVGDADIIENDTWIADNSPDENPYSVIEKSANMAVIRKLVDKLVGNEIYINLPQKSNYASVFGIGEQINTKIFEQYEGEYENILQNIQENRLHLLQKSGGDAEKLQTLVQVDRAGFELGQAEQQMERLFYKIRSKYSSEINKIILQCVFVMPFAATMFLIIAAWLLKKQKKRKIKEMFNE